MSWKEINKSRKSKNCQLLVTFSILKIDQVFERVYDMLQLTSPLFSKNGGLFFKFSKECFTYLAVGASFFIFFFFRAPYFTAASLIKRFVSMPFRLLFFSFWLPLGKVASFLLQWMQQKKYSTERTNKWGGFYEQNFGNKFEIGEVLPGIRL